MLLENPGIVRDKRKDGNSEMQKYNLLHNLFLTEKTSDKSSYEEKIHIQSMKNHDHTLSD
ncbi:hypothetical protein Ef18B226LT_26510 [Escherichia fergusonii]|nr:hypothetical protein Ef30038_29910 [Escherichia fergusonii]BES14072.1 hypothetical protein Ef18B226LT_26510 [Escherichia fergusonii]